MWTIFLFLNQKKKKSLFSLREKKKPVLSGISFLPVFNIHVFITKL